MSYWLVVGWRGAGVDEADPFPVSVSCCCHVEGEALVVAAALPPAGYHITEGRCEDAVVDRFPGPVLIGDCGFAPLDESNVGVVCPTGHCSRFR